MSFVRAPNPIWFFNDLTGKPLDDTYYAFFLENTLPYLPQAVYQDPNGTNAWTDPVQFQANGALPDNLYFPESATYRIEVRQGPTQSDPLIYEINNFVVGNGEDVQTDSVLSGQNIITNPQFADLFLPSGTVLATAGTYDIAPGWKLVLTGAGSTTITQTASAGANDIFTNPPYYLTISSSGWTSAQLIQQFNNNGAIFGGGGLTLSFMAFATSASQVITVSYNPSNVSNAQQIFGGSISTGGLQTYYGAIQAINDSNNTDVGEAAYTQIVFALPGTSTLTFTNIQVLGQSTNLSDAFVLPSGTTAGSVPLFREQTYEEVVNNEFHVYRDSIVIQPKESILTGWNFPLNPWQFTTTAVTTQSAQISYQADQTIVYQKAGGGSSIGVGQSGVATNNALKISAVTNSNIFALIQYIDPATIAPYWGNKLSSLVKALISSNSTPSNVPIKMRLIYRSTLPSAISGSEPIASWSGVDPVFSAGWTAIAPKNDPAYTLGSSYADYDFNGFQLPASSASTMTLGIVLYTTADMSSANSEACIFDQINLCANEYALESNVITWDECLRQCQYYYEKSYANGTLPGATTLVGELISQQNVRFNTLWKMLPSSFSFQFSTVKRAVPTISLWSPVTGTLDRVNSFIYVNGAVDAGSTPSSPTDQLITNWAYTVSSKNVSAVPNFNSSLINSSSSNSADFVSAAITYHFEAKARLGLTNG